MSLENIIKGKIASIIVGLMFQDANYLVINYGYEGLPGYLVQLGVLKDSKTTEMLYATPSFIVVNKKNHSVFLVQTKYQGANTSGRNVDWGYKKIQQYWSGSYLLLVRPRNPYFFIVTETKNGSKAIPLLDSRNFIISKKSILKFGQLVRKFLS